MMPPYPPSGNDAGAGTARGLSAAARLTVAFFRALEERNMPYCVVGDPAGVPEGKPGDIDVVVSRGDLRRIPQVLHEVCREAGGRLVQALHHETTACYFVAAVRGGGASVAYVKLDVCSDYRRNGALILGADELLAGRVRCGGPRETGRDFYVPSAAKALAYYLVKCVEKDKSGAEELAYLAHVYAADPDGGRRMLHRFWPESTAHRLEQVVGDKGADAASVWPEARAALRRRQPVLRIPDVREFARRAGRWLRPTGVFIAVYGPDGSGKTTAIDAACRSLEPAFRRTRRYHFRPMVGRPRDAHEGPVENPHGARPRGLLPSAAKVVYYVLDYVVGYHLRVRPALVRSSLVVFDRYYPDLEVDPLRYRYGGPLLLLRAGRHVVPQPQVSVVLDASPEILQQRKQEVPFQETERQRAAYLTVLARLPRGRRVDAGGTIPEVAAAVEDEVLDFMARRTAKRLGLNR